MISCFAFLLCHPFSMSHCFVWGIRKYSEFPIQSKDIAAPECVEACFETTPGAAKPKNSLAVAAQHLHFFLFFKSLSFLLVVLTKGPFLLLSPRAMSRSSDEKLPGYRSSVDSKQEDYASTTRHESGFMTAELLRRVCKNRADLYQTPELNEQLYLQHMNLREMNHLDEFPHLKSLWLENNAIAKIENIGHLTQLRALYLQNNDISRLENLSSLSHLHTLNLSHNSLRGALDLGAALAGLRSLTVLDLSHNEIESVVGLELCDARMTLRYEWKGDLFCVVLERKVWTGCALPCVLISLCFFFF